jgi:membrane-associated protease RseP (regulator of RpoE activity)
VSDARLPPPEFDAVPLPDDDARDPVYWVHAPVPEPRRFQHRYLRHVLFFLATFLTTTWAGTNQHLSFLLSSGSPAPPTNVAYYAAGLWYAIPVLLILGAHEFGHYFACRIHRVDATLPYFLPSPFKLVGTFGAVIRIHEAFPSRRALFDIGVAGPLAGFVVLVPFAFLGLASSHIVRFQPGGDYIFFGEPLLMKALSWMYFGPLPAGLDITPHPIWFAAWWGMFATALNLMPFGQLDGGHIAYAVLGPRARYVSMATLAIIGSLTMVSASWGVTAILLIVMAGFFGFRHPEPIDDHTPLDTGRVQVAVISAIILIICFMPVPMWF